MDLIFLYRIAHKCYSYKLVLISRLIEVLIFLIYNSRVPSSVLIGKGTKFAYWGIGCVLHKNTIMGENCLIGQGITIGGRGKRMGVPKIGSNVFIGAGARILGPITIGDNVIIAPNAVVIKDVNANSVVGGVPAKIIKEEVDNIQDLL
jgi:serine O-acetyltransferase